MFSWFAPSHKLVDRHFGQGKPLRSVAKLWRHLESCQTCRQRYRAHALLEHLNEESPRAAQERLAPKALKVAPSTYRPLMTLGGLGLAFAGLALFALPRIQGPTPPFVARGGAGSMAAASLSLYRVAAKPASDGPASKRLIEGTLMQGDGLAFSYTNPQEPGYAFLMVFAVDANRDVSWFWPAWQEPHTNPAAKEISEGGSFELPEAVFHDFAVGDLEIVGLFLKAPLHVKDVEAVIEEKGIAGLATPTTLVWRRTLEVKAP